ncbi:MAG: endonuclease/exonuclease/phosphatase family protein [Roseovarius sp.]
MAVLLCALPARSDTLRLASWNTDLERAGPGLLLRDLRGGGDAQIAAIVQVLAQTRPDVLTLQGVDYDLDLLALTALRDLIAEGGGPRYDHLFAQPSNAGLATGIDMDGDGRRGGPRDAQGFGAFAGQGGMALLSRYPLDPAGAQDFSALLWRDLPGALLPEMSGRPFPSQAARAVQRLSSRGHWVVPVLLPSGPLQVMTFHATPPVFDGPEDMNGRRNHDEIRFWQLYLDGAFGPPPQGRFVIMGHANLDPEADAGRPEVLRALLADPRLQDPRPMRPGPGPEAARRHTVHWPPPGPGARRVSYILPAADLSVTGAGVHWPPEGTPEGELAATASRHRLVWVDLSLP